MSKYIFLTRMIKNGMPCYNGNISVLITPDKSIESGDRNNTLTIKMNNHIGTHIDFPNHCISDGKTINDFPPDWFVFDKIFICDIPLDVGVCIDDKMLEQHGCMGNDAEMLILRTGYGRFYNDRKYWYDNPGLSPKAAKYIKNSFPKLRALGVDFISINAYSYKEDGRKAHIELMKNDEIAIIEDMDLSSLTEHVKRIVVAPLLIYKADGAPCNVMAEV